MTATTARDSADLCDLEQPSGFWLHDDPDDDHDEGDDTAELEVPIVGVNNAVRCPCPPMAPYPAGWLNQRQQEAIDYLRRQYPTADTTGGDVWVPRKAPGRVPVVTLDTGKIVLLETEVTVFRPGCWVNMDHKSLTGGA